jgi:hypothetical protein
MQQASPEITAALREREPIFHRPGFGQNPEEADAIMTEDYWEIGASGSRYERAFVLEVLRQRAAQPPDDVWSIEEFECREAGPGTYLVTYLLKQGARQPRITRRSTLWRQREGEWELLYHQGTMVAATV